MSFNGMEEFIDPDLRKRWAKRDLVYSNYQIEERLRKDSPALQNAWDQYQVVLQLVKEQSNVETNNGTDGSM